MLFYRASLFSGGDGDMKRESTLYLYEHQRDFFIQEILDVKKSYFEMMKPTLINVLDSQIEELEKNYEEHNFFLYRYYRLVKYRHICLQILSLCEFWEQQVISFINGMISLNYLYDRKKITTYNEMERILMDFYPGWTALKKKLRIEELRCIVNVIKHSEGKSLERLKKEYPSRINNDIFSFETSMSSEILNLNEKDIALFSESLVQFWLNFPVNQHLVR